MKTIIFLTAIIVLKLTTSGFFQGSDSLAEQPAIVSSVVATSNPELSEMVNKELDFNSEGKIDTELVVEENELLRLQLRASEQREAVLKRQLEENWVNQIDVAQKLKPAAVGLVQHKPLVPGLQLVTTLACGAKRELCFHQDGTWYVHDRHRNGTVNRIVATRLNPSPNASFICLLGDDATQVYEVNGTLEVVIAR
jgi:hypothetical protein